MLHLDLTDATTLRVILALAGTLLLLGLYWWEWLRAPELPDDPHYPDDATDADAPSAHDVSGEKREPQLGTLDHEEPAAPAAAPRWGSLSARLRRQRAAPETLATEAETPPDAAPVDDQHVLVQLFVVVPEETISGADIMAAAAKHQLVPGEHAIFHRHAVVKPAKGDAAAPPAKRTLFQMANLVKPGNFPFGTGMREFQTRGLALFAQLDGGSDDLHTLDAMLSVAHDLADGFNGLVQDETRSPLTPLQTKKLRERVRTLQKTVRQQHG